MSEFPSGKATAYSTVLSTYSAVSLPSGEVGAGGDIPLGLSGVMGEAGDQAPFPEPAQDCLLPTLPPSSPALGFCPTHGTVPGFACGPGTQLLAQGVGCLVPPGGMMTGAAGSFSDCTVPTPDRRLERNRGHLWQLWAESGCDRRHGLCSPRLQGAVWWSLSCEDGAGEQGALVLLG